MSLGAQNVVYIFFFQVNFIMNKADKDYANRLKVLALLNANMSHKKIMEVVGVKKMTIYLVKRLKREAEEEARESVEEALKITRAGPKFSVVNRRNIDMVRKRALRNPHQSTRNLARMMGIAETSMRKLLAATGIRSMSKLVVREIFPTQEAKRKERAAKLLEWHTRNPGKVILWTDEKSFTVEAHINRRNDRILVPVRATTPPSGLSSARKKPPVSWCSA